MTSTETIRILKEYQKWRRGLPPYDAMGVPFRYEPSEIGEAIDSAIDRIAPRRGKGGRP